MLGNFNIETFVDVHRDTFDEYLSSIIARLPEKNEDYRAIQFEIEGIYKQYPSILGIFDSERAVALTKEECEAIIKVNELKNRLITLEMQTVYFRGCYDGVGYLKKAHIL